MSLPLTPNNITTRHDYEYITALLSIKLEMDKYLSVKKIGDGTYGCVYLAKNKDNGDRVAIKM